MAWIEHGDHWRRPLDCHDRQFQVIAELGKRHGREQSMLMGVVQLEVLDDEMDLKRYYPVRDEADLEAWCDETFRVENLPSSDEVLGDLMRTAAPQATCHWVPTSNQLCLLASLTPLPRGFDGSEARHLAPTLDVVLGMPETINPAWEARADEVIAPTFQEENQRSIGLPIAPERSTASPHNTRRVALRINAEQAVALRRECHQQGVTLTTAVHASVTAETPLVCTRGASKYVAPVVVDLRKYCPPPFDGPVHAPSLRMLALPLVVDAGQPWSEIAQAIQPAYRHSFDPEKSDMLFVRVPYVNKVTALLEPMKDIHPSSSSEPHPSSLGVIDGHIQRTYGGVEVRDVSFGIQMVTGQVLVYFWSWRGEMHLSASYNEAYYTQEHVRGWLEAVRENLVENLLEAKE
ncbi:hypothetical protein BDW74DRAFT_190080 [Aspergillus multicolor]|uniref:uncharacterized protein n=1 Tax=Aspergillus multicolor TaxID=41759 RepID=UPI003CCDF70D